MLKRIVRFCARLIRWIPILWNQEEYDSGYIYELMRVKLLELQRSLEKDTLHLGNDKHIRDIKVCLGHLDRYRHWERYVDIPDIAYEFEPTEDGFYKQVSNPKLDSAYKKAIKYEQENYEQFWRVFLKHHQHWWC